ncbi:MAG: GNAT family N-acetyltransferase, partial [Selenomonadaceae bacterium]|nr:GNAT family N-acetyltransferase [Selenomonadaceae bacterium]
TLRSETDELSEDRIIKGMVGRELTNRYPKRENCPIGDVIFEVKDWNAFHPDDSNRQILTCAVKKACEYIFAHSDVVRIFAEPFAYNMASCRVLEKVGFQLEGILRSNAVKNGTVIDMSLYAKIK